MTDTVENQVSTSSSWKLTNTDSDQQTPEDHFPFEVTESTETEETEVYNNKSFQVNFMSQTLESEKTTAGKNKANQSKTTTMFCHLFIISCINILYTGPTTNRLKISKQS